MSFLNIFKLPKSSMAIEEADFKAETNIMQEKFELLDRYRCNTDAGFFTALNSSNKKEISAEIEKLMFPPEDFSMAYFEIERLNGLRIDCLKNRLEVLRSPAYQLKYC